MRREEALGIYDRWRWWNGDVMLFELLTGAELEWESCSGQTKLFSEPPSARKQEPQETACSPTAAFLTKPPSAANCELNSSNLLLRGSSTASSYYYLKRTHV